jgi:mycothiol system anti-sigma-R factor
MTCEESLQKLSQYLDRELDDTTASELARHLAECRQCFSLAEFERRLREMVRRSCDCIEAPPSLRERLNEILRSY